MNRKKVGIVTYHRAVNYGAILQAYALNRKIKTFDIDVETIDYSCDAVNVQYDYHKLNKCASLKNFVAHNLTCFLRRRKKIRFIEFLKRFSLSETCDRESIRELSRKYEIFITGSDQVFNPLCHKNDPTYFLDFVSAGSKNCYAASLGSISQFESSKIDVIPLLKEFDKISFRETDATEYMESVLDKKCTTVMDPVWLLDKNEWCEIAVSNEKKQFIFVYNLMDYKYMEKFVSKLSKETGLPVVVVNRTFRGDLLYFGGAKSRSNCSPEEFLGYIRDAQYVVTDSFHGTSLSILFEKQICIALNPATDNTNSRLHTILNLAGLSDYTIDKNRLICKTESINYDVVNERLMPQINNSVQFPKSIVFCE